MLIQLGSCGTETKLTLTCQMFLKFHDLLGFSYCPRTVLPGGPWCMGLVFFCDVLAVEAGFHLLIPPIHHLYPLYSTSYSTSQTQFQSAEGKGLPEFRRYVVSFCPLLSFFCVREKLRRKTKFECSLFLSYYFLASLFMKRPKSIPKWSESCVSDCRPVKFKDFHWWSSENLPTGNLISSHLCLGITWWPYKLDIQ